MRTLVDQKDLAALAEDWQRQIEDYRNRAKSENRPIEKGKILGRCATLILCIRDLKAVSMIE